MEHLMFIKIHHSGITIRFAEFVLLCFFNQSTKFEVHFTVTEDLDIRFIKILNNSLRSAEFVLLHRSAT